MATKQHSKVDAHTIYCDISFRLSQAQALCSTIGAASRPGQEMPDEAIDMSLTAVHALLQSLETDVFRLYNAARSEGHHG